MNIGVIYIAVNKKKGRSDGHAIKSQYELAVISAKSVRKHVPNLGITLYTNLNVEFDEVFDNVVKVDQLETHHLMWQKKWEYLSTSPYDITLHLDADTYVCDDFSEIFPLMDHFDMAIPMSPHYFSRKIGRVPKSYPELAGGMFIWKKNEKMIKFINDMIEELKNRRRYFTDEPYLRMLLYESDIRYSVLPMEYNCVITHPGYLYGKIKIAHGRCDLVENAEIMNRDTGKRIFSGETLYLMDTAQKFLTVVEEIKYGHSKYTGGPKKIKIPEGETF